MTDYIEFFHSVFVTFLVLALTINFVWLCFMTFKCIVKSRQVKFYRRRYKDTDEERRHISSKYNELYQKYIRLCVENDLQRQRIEHMLKNGGCL